MKKELLFLILLLLLIPPYPLRAGPEENSQAALALREALAEQEEALDLSQLEDFLDEVDQEIKSYLPQLSISKMISSFKEGKLDLSPQKIIEGISRYFFHEVTANLSLMGKLLVIAIICATLQNLQAAFEGGTVAKLAYYVCFLAVATIAIGSFHIAVSAALTAIGSMVRFMELLLPILLVLLTVMGGLTSAALFQPFLMVFLGFMGFFTEAIIFPLIYLTAVLSIANNISESFKVSKLTLLLKQATKAGIGLVLTLFVGVITVEGVTGGVVDGVSLRTAKFVTGAFVPVAGSMFADALDAVMGGSLLLKNALGLTGVVVLSLIILFPVIKLLAIALIYRVTAALLQPLGDSPLADTLEEIAGSLFLTFAAVLSVGIMFFLAITVLVATANFTMMLR